MDRRTEACTGRSYFCKSCRRQRIHGFIVVSNCNVVLLHFSKLHSVLCVTDTESSVTSRFDMRLQLASGPLSFRSFLSWSRSMCFEVQIIALCILYQNNFLFIFSFKNGSLTRERFRRQYAEDSWEKFSSALKNTPPVNYGNLGGLIPAVIILAYQK